MDEKKRIEEIKNGLKKSVYEEAARIHVKELNDSDSTEKLSNILEGYVDRIDTIAAGNMEELEEELRVLKERNVEVGEMVEKDNLVQQYNDYIHNDLDRTIAETVEYTYNLNNKTDDLNDILIRPMEGEDIDHIEPLPPLVKSQVEEIAPDTDELFEIEATTDLGVFEDIVELEADTLDIAGTAVDNEITIGSEEPVVTSKDKNTKKSKPEKPKKEKKATSKKDKQATSKKAEKPKSKQVEKASDKKTEKETIADDFKDEKGLATFDYVLIVVLVVIFAALIGLIAKINGVF